MVSKIVTLQASHRLLLMRMGGEGSAGRQEHTQGSLV